MLLLNQNKLPELKNLPAEVEIETIRNHGHYDFLAAFRTRSRLRNFSPALAIAHCSRSVALLKRALKPDVPVLAVSHSNKVRRLLPADAYLALSAHIAAKFEQAGTGKACYQLPNMIRMNPADRTVINPRHQPVRIGALGRFDPVKGFDILVEALAMLRQQGYLFEAVLAGSGEEQAALEVQLTQAGLDECVTLPGWVDDVPDFLSTIDILCVPARSDAFGLTPLEGARASVPMVLSTASGHVEMLEDNRQALFAEVGDVAATAARIAQLIDDPALADSLSQVAFRRVAECYSEAVVGEQLEQLINKIVN